MKYKVTYFLHVQGMPFPDSRDYGEIDATDPAAAVESMLKIHFPRLTGAAREYTRGCLTAKVVEPFPKHFAPRTDDVLLVKLEDIPKMARILCNRVLEPDMRYEEEVWEANKDDFIRDIRVVLGLPEVAGDEKVI